jgi:hypothetical protein
MLFSPRWLYLYPGMALIVLGAAVMVWLIPGPRVVAGISLDIHTLYYAALAIVIGVHSVLFWVLGRVYGMREGVVATNPHFLSILRHFSLERCLIAGCVFILLCLGLGAAALFAWGKQRSVRLAWSRPCAW